MKSEYGQLKEYMAQSKKTVAVTGSGISYLYGMSRLKKSVGRLNAGRIFSASYVRKNPEEFYEEGILSVCLMSRRMCLGKRERMTGLR